MSALPEVNALRFTCRQAEKIFCSLLTSSRSVFFIFFARVLRSYNPDR